MLRALKSKSLKSTFQLHQIAYCSSDVSKSERRKKILRIRFEQKQLFGHVIRNESHIQKTDHGKNIASEHMHNQSENKDALSPFDLISEPTNVPDIKLNAPELTSEFHWLSQTSNIKILKNNKSRSKISKESNDVPKPDKKIIETKTKSNTTQIKASVLSEPSNVIISAKNLLQQIITNKRNQQHEIPFDNDALKSIVSYPMICEKNSLSQTQELIGDSPIRLPSISKILQATMSESSRFALKKWKMDKIEELGYDGFKQYERETFERGTQFHLAIEHFLDKGEKPEENSPIIKLWHSVDHSLNELKPKSVLLEQPILHADLKYKGIIDNVSIVKNELCAFEWKTSEKSKPYLTSTYDAPVQLCAYLGALNADPRYDLTVKNGCVVVAYINGDKANVFNLSEANLRKYWLIWLQRLQEYWIRFRDGTIPDPV